MTLFCLIGGCSWSPSTSVHIGKEDLLCQVCARCGACRYSPANAVLERGGS
ncbi:PSPA7_2676 family Cys-rich small protein [Pseudomonas tohonis]|uniref:PSPA7_2676 family Cys-rich small protein n=1 Tax=Pseudomonas tohonis TaxID=2725477 RepID=UPI001565DA99|nr:PSPA7_2676 family Cys-rich small protein [Pseudomonas tohonis]